MSSRVERRTPDHGAAVPSVRPRLPVGAAKNHLPGVALNSLWQSDRSTGAPSPMAGVTHNEGDSGTRATPALHVPGAGVREMRVQHRDSGSATRTATMCLRKACLPSRSRAPSAVRSGCFSTDSPPAIRVLQDLHRGDASRCRPNNGASRELNEPDDGRIIATLTSDGTLPTKCGSPTLSPRGVYGAPAVRPLMRFTPLSGRARSSPNCGAAAGNRSRGGRQSGRRSSSC